MLRIAIIGCGKIADQHVLAIRRLPDCSLVALCDREVLMARQLGERFGISKLYADVGDLLRGARPDVVHITTPPQSHFPLARQCLEANVNVYLEKPFTLTAPEAEELIRLAQHRNLRITAGHNLQFTNEMLEMRRLVRSGFLGGSPVHLERHFSYSLDDTTYIGAVLGSRDHWVRRLPGQLFHNIVSHGIAKLSEFLDDDIIEIVARAHQSPRLRELGRTDVMDELRVLIRDRNNTTAFFCFSTQLRPGINRLNLHGPSATIVVDHATGSILRVSNAPSKSYLTFFAPQLYAARELLGNSLRNFSNIVRRRLYQDAGMTELFQQFYRCIPLGQPPPIPYREVILTARLMDEIFSQIYPTHAAAAL